MSAKDCDDIGHRRRKLFRGLFAGIVSFIIIILIVILILWLVLRPTHPRFILQEVTVNSLNLTDGNTLNTNMQITVSSRNPNDHIGVYYDRLDAFAVYKGQQITVPSGLPRGYQGHNDYVVWSPYLFGNGVPLAPYLAAGVQQDANAGFILIYIKLDGKVRWKVGSWMSGHYHLTVSCPAFFTCDNGGKSFKFRQMSTCSVDV